MISRAQLIELGVEPRALSHPLAAGRLHQVHARHPGHHSDAHDPRPGRDRDPKPPRGPSQPFRDPPADRLPSLDALARAHPGHRGAARLQRTLRTHYAGEVIDRSDLEILFAELCAREGLPTPRINQPVAGKEVDFLFARERLIVEVDSWRYHKTRRAFEDDRARDVLTTAAGYRTLRFTDRQLTRHPHAVAQAIQAVLAARRAA